MAKLYPVSYGSHNNVHMVCTLESKSNPKVIIRLTTFFSTETAHILDVKYKVPKKSLNFKTLKQKLAYELDKYDFVLDMTDNDWNNEGLSTEELIKNKQLNFLKDV